MHRHDYVGDVVNIRIGTENLRATGHHPFFVASGPGLTARPAPSHTAAIDAEQRTTGRWVCARDLRVSDELVSLATGQTAKVEAISTCQERVSVYNLTIEDLHTFAVGEGGVLVHNRPFRYTVKNFKRLISQGRIVWDPIQARWRHKIGQKIGRSAPTVRLPKTNEKADLNVASKSRPKHILDGDAISGGGHVYPGRPGHSPFPPHWSRRKIMNAISEVWYKTVNSGIPQTGSGGLLTKKGLPAKFRHEGVVDGVNIRVIAEPAGRGIVTGFPIPW